TKTKYQPWSPRRTVNQPRRPRAARRLPPASRRTRSRYCQARAPSAVDSPRGPWYGKGSSEEVLHGAIPLEQAGQGAAAQGEARSEGGPETRASRAGADGRSRRRHRLESGGRHQSSPGRGGGQGRRDRRGGRGRGGGGGRKMRSRPWPSYWRRAAVVSEQGRTKPREPFKSVNGLRR